MPISTRTLTLTQPAKRIVAGENPIIFNLASQVVGTNVNHSEVIEFTSAVSHNYRFNIRSLNAYIPYTFYEADFTAKNTPNADQYFLCNTLKDESGTILGYPSTAEVASSFFDALTKDSYLSKHYYISLNGNQVIITAKVPSENYTISVQRFLGSGASTTSGTTLTDIANGEAATAGAGIDGYSIYADVYTPILNPTAKQYSITSGASSGDFNRVASLVLPYNPTNQHQFDISEICKSYLSTSRPDFDYGLPWNEVEYVKPFLIKYGEYLPIVSGVGSKTRIEKGTSSIYYVCNASLPRTSANNMSAYSGTSTTALFAKFLTNQPTKKKTSRYAKELLYILIPKDFVTTGDSIVITSTVTYWDGTSDVNPTLDAGASTVFFLSDGNYGCVYRLDMSYDNIGLDAIETSTGKKIKEVLFRVYKNYTDQLSDNIYYQYPYNETENINAFHIAFLNSLGTYDTVLFKGLKEETLERTKQDLTYALQINNDGSLSQGFKNNGQYDVQVTKKITVNSGWITESEFNWLQELIASNDIYNYSSSTSLNYLKLESHKYSKNNQSNEYFIELTFVQTIYENNVSI